MKPEERAEKIMWEVHAWYDGHHSNSALEALIAAAIREAEQEAYKRGLEEAAKVAEPTLDPKPCECFSCISRRVVAHAIRSLAQGGGL